LLDKLEIKKLALAGDWAPCLRKVDELGATCSLIFNLEGPVRPERRENYFESQKAGPSMANSYLPTTKYPALVTLANNHIMDFGATGLVKSIEKIVKNGWLYAGAGTSVLEAQRPAFFDWFGKRVALISRCETQFGIASKSKAGVAALDSSIYKQIRLLKKESDLLIVSIHAAAEMIPWPSPRRQENWRSLIDEGVDVIHGHHAHVPQGWEEYNGGFIFYGLGNFCVDPNKWSWHPQGLWSLAPELEVVENRIKLTIQTKVIEDLGESVQVREADEAEYAKHLAYLDKCNYPLSNRALLEGLWQEASVRMYNEHYARWLGFQSLSFVGKSIQFIRENLIMLRKSFVNTGAGSHYPSRSQMLLWYHLFVCDSHNDAISTALGVLAGELEDQRSEVTAMLVNELVA
jgi:poly-gamma-glutamate synthesis protein (capsule biosynthesis protein)